MRHLILTLLMLTTMAPPASAHRMWINVFESSIHQPSHAMISLGWGHVLPMDDILTSTNSRVEMDSFKLIDPSNHVMDLTIPPFDIKEPKKTTANVDLFAADLGTQKVALKKESQPGVYQFAATTKPTFYTSYIDSKGHKRMQLKSLNEIKDVKEVLASFKYQAFAKSSLTVGDWKQPAPLGHGLEIVPCTDLSNLHAGDLVEVKVLFYGEPLSATAQSMDFIAAYSGGFGQSENFFLGAYLMNGHAKFRVQNAGQWIVALYHKDDVTPDGPLKDLHGKVEQVYHSATLTFNVK